MKPTLRKTTLSLALATAALAGCNGGATSGMRDNNSNEFRTGLPPAVRDSDKLGLTDPSVDYLMALRTAAIKLTGNYPTISEIQELQKSPNQSATYAARIDDYMSRPSFAVQQISFWRNTFHMGGADSVTAPTIPGTTAATFEFAPTFAAMLVVQGQDFSNLVKASSGTCPTFTVATGTFNSANCANNTPTAGVLSDQGAMAQFTSSLAFRRTRWIQETFMCVRFPAEQNGQKIQYSGGVYQNPWPWNSFAGNESEPNPLPRVNFQVTDGLICGNCHGTMNHIAPLLGKFDASGVLKTTFQVTTPVTGTPISQIQDWLPSGETTGWRYMVPAADLPSLGAAIAADPGFNRCMATRVWNWAMSRGDAVYDSATITDDLAVQLTSQLAANNNNMKMLIKSVFTDANFVRY